VNSIPAAVGTSVETRTVRRGQVHRDHDINNRSAPVANVWLELDPGETEAGIDLSAIAARGAFSR